MEARIFEGAKKVGQEKKSTKIIMEQEFLQVGRITSLHGVLIPPKKKLVVKNYRTLRFVIEGTIPSKKNMIWADSNINVLLRKLHSYKVVTEAVAWLKDNLKVYIRNSKKYTDWLEAAKPKIIEQAAKGIAKYQPEGMVYPLSLVSIKVYHYWKDNIERDNSNKYDTIIDLFVSCGVLTDDCWQVVRKNESEAQWYEGQILDHITTIDITYMY